MKTYLDYQIAGVEFEDWPVLVQDEYREGRMLNAEEKWYREHPEEAEIEMIRDIRRRGKKS